MQKKYTPSYTGIKYTLKTDPSNKEVFLSSSNKHEIKQKHFQLQVK